MLHNPKVAIIGMKLISLSYPAWGFLALTTLQSTSHGLRKVTTSARYVTSLRAHSAKIEDVLRAPQWPEKWPFTPTDFKRQDEDDDSYFYNSPRLVYHIDDPAVSALTQYYRDEFSEGADVLDICSSWISHFPNDVRLGRRVGLGMNKMELAENKQLDEFVVQNLNKDPILPFKEESFDFVTCVVSVDYLTRPLEVGFPDALNLDFLYHP